MKRSVIVGLAMTMTLTTACGPILPGDAGPPPAPTAPRVAPDETTSVPPTTPPETTTVPEPPTTTTVVPSGPAVIVASGGFLGWWDQGWHRPTDVASAPQVDGEEMTLLGPTGEIGTAAAGPVADGCEIVENHLIIGLTPDPYEAYTPFDPSPVAVSAGWDLTPFAITALPTDSGPYVQVASDFLSSRGFEEASPVITQLYQTDLEGDGTDEVVIVADNHGGEFFHAGVYSVVLVRKVVAGDVETAVLHESIVTEFAEGETPFTVTGHVVAIADLDGDGEMEIVLDEAYYEGSASLVWDYANDDLGFVEVLSTGCGA